jgi:hypothetical protein
METIQLAIQFLAQLLQLSVWVLATMFGFAMFRLAWIAGDYVKRS